jgi:hypothetical protein
MSPESYPKSQDPRLSKLRDELNEIYKDENAHYIIINDLDLSNLDLSDVIQRNTVFENCNLNGTKFGFSCLYIRNCQAGIDIRGTHLFITAIESNFAHIKYDHDTKIGHGASGGNNSIFTRCVTTREFRERFKKQGAMFTDVDSLYGSLPILSTKKDK